MLAIRKLRLYDVDAQATAKLERSLRALPERADMTVVRGEWPGRRRGGDVTIFDSVGFALEDCSALRFLHALLAWQRGARMQIDLVAQLADPKNLFGGTSGVKTSLRRVAWRQRADGRLIGRAGTVRRVPSA
jgi:ornithine cyclodeaminase